MLNINEYGLALSRIVSADYQLESTHEPDALEKKIAAEERIVAIKYPPLPFQSPGSSHCHKQRRRLTNPAYDTITLTAEYKACAVAMEKLV